ncbi:MAG: hypothetical protein JWM74_70, partial [Myxococcaceae bacterium]|nr:hypothetical protein [Myxococcaceae bacterium]
MPVRCIVTVHSSVVAPQVKSIFDVEAVNFPEHPVFAVEPSFSDAFVNVPSAATLMRPLTAPAPASAGEKKRAVQMSLAPT